MILQPLPCSPPSGLCRGVDFDAPFARQSGYVSPGFVSGTKLAHLLFGKFDLSVFFTTVCSAVLDAIHGIVGSRSPSQMLRIYAGAISAIMCRVSKLGRARSVNDLANQTMHAKVFGAPTNMRISAAVEGKRPFDAICGGFSQCVENEI